VKKIDVKRRELDIGSFKTRSAVEADYSELITEDCALYENGRLILLYVTPKESLEYLRSACDQISYSHDMRSSGMVTTSRVFGFEPRKALRKDFCSTTSLATESPEQHDAIMGAGKLVSKYYSKLNPSLYCYHDSMSRKKLSAQYRVEGMPFTSGIVNKNNPLKYHFDAGNYESVWSGMVTLKSGISGGHIALPEFNIGVELKDRTFFMFDGQGILHGVTPIKRHHVDAMRYTVVYYSLKQMWKCETITDELIRIRKRRTEREKFGAREAYIEKEKSKRAGK
tara:strand:- start:561 stop:1406 length:846 start_codon:yes stop_codon:yes gene_type:complete